MAGPGNILSAQIVITLPDGSRRAFETTAAGAAKVEASLKKLPQTANAATLSMINLGRVVQDAPFGFLGIANNLNPLLESFQRLKATTGTTGGALKALGSSLMGAGGLGFALSIVSTGLILFGDKLFGAGVKAKEATSAADKFREAVAGIFQETAKEGAQVSVLVGLLQSETETRERKLQAIKELQKIQPEIFAGLKLEGEAVIGLDSAYRNYIANLSTVIAVKIKQSQLETLITRQLELQGATLTKSVKDAIAGINLQRTTLTETGKVIPLLQDVNNKKAAQLKVDKENERVQSDILALIKEIAELSKGVKLPDFKDPKGKREIIFTPVLDLENRGQLQAQFKKIFDNISGDIIPELHIKPKDSDKIFDNLKKEVSKTPLILPIPIDAKIILNAEQVTQQAEIIRKGLENIIVEGLSGLGEAIGEGLAGGDLGKGIKSFLSSIAGAIQGLGKQLIAFAVAQKLAIEAAKKFNPILTAAAGLALVVIGAAMRKAISGGTGQGFAEGGYTGPGGKYQPAGIVHKGEYVIPAFAVNRLGVGYLNNLAFGNNIRGYAQGGFVTGAGITGGGLLNVSGEFVLRRDVLIAAIKQGQASQGRLT